MARKSPLDGRGRLQQALFWTHLEVKRFNVQQCTAACKSGPERGNACAGAGPDRDLGNRPSLASPVGALNAPNRRLRSFEAAAVPAFEFRRDSCSSTYQQHNDPLRLKAQI